MNKKIFSTFLICSLLMVSNFDASEVNYAPVHPTSEEVEAAEATTVVEFKDENLEQAVADELGVEAGTITVGDMETLTSLNGSGKEISDLTGLEYAINLASLSLYENKIDNVEALSGLTNLTYLDLRNNKIDNIEALSGLTNLTILNLQDNQIDNIEALSGLTNLTSLDLRKNQLESEDLEVLSGLTNLTNLYLSDNQIDNVEALRGLTNLTYLEIENNQISDVSPLSSLTDMDNIWIGYQDMSQYVDGELQTITVYSDEEITVDVTDIDGSTHTLSTGTLTPGRDSYHDEYLGVDLDPWVLWEGPFDNSFMPYLNADVIYNTLLGDDAASTIEETVLSDEDLITLFEVYSIVDETVTVDQSGVDYSTPGDYDVIFTDESSNEFVGVLTVTDVLPTIDVNEGEVTIEIGSSLDDILAGLGYSATEITEGDLTDSVVIDDSSVDYNTAGTYEVVFSVTDEEGNIITKTVTVIVEGDEVIIDSESNNEVVSETNSEDTKMSLATTGSVSSLALAIGLISIMGLASIKKATNK